MTKRVILIDNAAHEEDSGLLSDEQIIARILRGHIEDFRELMQRHQNAVFRLAYRVLGRREDAEDAVQETFIRVYQSLADLEKRDRLWPWARRIALNVCLDKLPREFPSDQIEGLSDPAPSVECPVEAEALSRIGMDEIRRAVNGLPPTYKVAIVLRYLEDMSTLEIADLLNESVTSIRVRLHRARKMLSERLAVIRDGV